MRRAGLSASAELLVFWTIKKQFCHIFTLRRFNSNGVAFASVFCVLDARVDRVRYATVAHVRRLSTCTPLSLSLSLSLSVCVCVCVCVCDNNTARTAAGSAYDRLTTARNSNGTRNE